MTRDEVFKIIDDERHYQEQKWGSDEGKSLGDFLVYMEYYLRIAKDSYSTDKFEQTKTFLRKAVAVGVAAMELHGVPKRN